MNSVMTDLEKEKFLAALEDEQVQIRIRQIASGMRDTVPSANQREKDVRIEELTRNLMEFQKKYQSLQSALAEKEKKLQEANDTIKILDKARVDLGETLLQVRNELVKEQHLSNQYQELAKNMKQAAKPYEAIQKAFEKYGTLPPEILEELKYVIRRENVIAFLISGTQIENIKTLWNYIRSNLNRFSQQHVDILTDTLAFFVDQINMFYEKPGFRFSSEPTGFSFLGR